MPYAPRFLRPQYLLPAIALFMFMIPILDRYLNPSTGFMDLRYSDILMLTAMAPALFFLRLFGVEESDLPRMRSLLEMVGGYLIFYFLLGLLIDYIVRKCYSWSGKQT